MKILYYVEPLIERGRPFWKEGWATCFARDLINTMRGFSQPPEAIGMVLNEPLASRFSMENVERFILTQNELLNGCLWHYLDLTVAWHCGTFTTEVHDYYVQLYRRRLEGFRPDVVITFSPVPFLQALFPHAFILHYEYCLFSRPPYPQTFYLDPLGMGGDRYPSTFWPQIEPHVSFGETQRALLAEFQERCRRIILAKSPYRAFCEACRRRFRRLVLLPLQFSGYYLFDAYVPYRGQYDYLIDVLERVPRDVGVVVTSHSDYPALSEEVIAYCRMKYPHFIYDEAFTAYESPSQYLINAVDAVITVSSKVAAEALLWEKKLVVLWDGFFPLIADGGTLSELPAVFEAPPRDKSAILYWLLTHYAIPAWKLHDPAWLEAFLQRGVELYGRGEIDAGFYVPIDTPETLFPQWTAALSEDIPRPSVATLRRRELEKLQSAKLSAEVPSAAHF